MIVYNPATVEAIVRESKGRFMTIEFIKANGEVRTINGRIGVHWHGIPAVARHSMGGKQYLLVWEVRTRSYRNIALDRVRSIRTQGLKVATQAQQIAA